MSAHILRRMGFGASPEDLAHYGDLSPGALVQTLLNFDQVADDVDANIGRPDFAGITTRGQFQPDTVINDARQRWIFRMLHSRRPLQEKMALFWHNHFATAYSKISGVVGAAQATKMMDGTPRSFGGASRGQIQLFRDLAAASFHDLPIEVAKDPAMLVWLDNRVNIRTRPQENFARELMELFTIGVGEYTEEDVYAAARVFTGWNLELVGDRNDPASSYLPVHFQPEPARHGRQGIHLRYRSRRRPHDSHAPGRAGHAGRPRSDRCAGPSSIHRHAPCHAVVSVLRERRGRTGSGPGARGRAQAYRASGGSIKATLQRLFLSEPFLSGASAFRRYAWPVEFATRSIKEVGWRGLSVDSAITPLANMGQQLYEPPDVNGWALGAEWFSTASMLARMNYAATLAANQKFNLARDAQAHRQSPERVLGYLASRFATAGFGSAGYSALLEYLQAGAAWSGSDAQLNTKVAGAVRLIVGAGEYQFN